MARGVSAHGAGSRVIERPPRRLPEISPAKLLRPPSRPGVLHRSALTDRLRTAPDSVGVVSVTAPAGYGKTMLLADWADHDDRPFAWVSLDERDNDPGVFLSHVAVALDRIEPIDDAVLQVLTSPGAWDPERVVRRLETAVAQRAGSVVVLDDLEAVNDALCLDAVSRLCQSMPPGSLIAIASRVTPRIRLPRLRADGRLLELGAEDLALSPREVADLLEAMDAPVTSEEAREIADASEGWPVAVYLAGLARKEGSAFVPPTSTGQDRFIVDYVRSEVLDPVDEAQQRFLFRTSILRRMSGPLCDAVLERSGSAGVLRSIERRNLLLVPLDRRREWYRYHNLFRDVLVSTLRADDPGVVPELHRRAADWFESQGMASEAIEHAFAAGDEDRAAILLQRIAMRDWQSGRIASLRSWLDRFGDGAVTRNVGLAVLAAWLASEQGDAPAADRWASVVEGGSTDGPSYLGTASLRSSIALLRCVLCRDGPASMRREAEIALREESEVSPFRPTAHATLGMALLLEDDVEHADESFARCVEVGMQLGAFSTTAFALAERSLIAASLGNATDAAEHAEAGDDLVRRAHVDEHVVIAPVHVASARVALRAGDEEGARAELARAQRLRPRLTYAFPTVALQVRLELARVCLGLGDVTGARTLMTEATEILEHRPELGMLARQAHELLEHVGTIRTRQVAGPSTLTAAELRLLSFLPTHLTFRQIGARLYVAESTVKTQALSIYRKFRVSSRSDAVEAARESGLLEA